tara:strand:- start:482 stop:586 length:105 start_codon:yes stop_codon:yes gene_type:complete
MGISTETLFHIYLVMTGALLAFATMAIVQVMIWN